MSDHLDSEHTNATDSNFHEVPNASDASADFDRTAARAYLDEAGTGHVAILTELKERTLGDATVGVMLYAAKLAHDANPDASTHGGKRTKGSKIRPTDLDDRTFVTTVAMQYLKLGRTAIYDRIQIGKRLHRDAFGQIRGTWLDFCPKLLKRFSELGDDDQIDIAKGVAANIGEKMVRGKIERAFKLLRDAERERATSEAGVLDPNAKPEEDGEPKTEPCKANVVSQTLTTGVKVRFPLLKGSISILLGEPQTASDGKIHIVVSVWEGRS